MKYVRIVDQTVTNVIELANPPSFEEPEARLWIAVPDEIEVEPFWVVTPTGYARPTVDQLPVDLVAYAADRRWRLETGGIVVAGLPIATDDRSKIMIMGARVAAMADPQWSTIWHGADGGTYPVDAATMVVISNDVQAHVNTSFAAFATVKAGILSGAITTSAEIDAAFEAQIRPQ